MRKKEEHECVSTVSCILHKEASAGCTTSQWGLRLEKEGREVRWAGVGGNKTSGSLQHCLGFGPLEDGKE